MADFIFCVQEEKAWTITGHGRVIGGRAFGHNYPEDPKALCSLAPPKGTEYWLIRPFQEPVRFTSWGTEMFLCGGGGIVCGIGIPDDLEVKQWDLFVMCGEQFEVAIDY